MTSVVYLSFRFVVIIFLSIGFSIGVFLGVGCLLYIQLKIAFSNMTSIEEWIMIKSVTRTDGPFVYPYDLGWWRNLKLLFLQHSNGINWPIREGCPEFSLTAEQVRQKAVKALETRHFVAQRSYNGSWFPLFSQGFWTCVNFPFSDEPRIRFHKSDVLRVTRIKKYWLYGEIDTNATDNAAVNTGKRSIAQRGWFPRNAVVEMIFTSEDQSPGDNKKNK